MSEFIGDISLILNVIAVILVMIGVVGRKGSQKVMMRHGYLSLFAFILKVATVFLVMLPALFSEFLGEVSEFSILQVSFLWIKIILGIVGTIMGFVCIVPWYFKPREDMACLKVKKWMMPTLIVWVLAVLMGAFVHLSGII